MRLMFIPVLIATVLSALPEPRRRAAIVARRSRRDGDAAPGAPPGRRDVRGRVLGGGPAGAARAPAAGSCGADARPAREVRAERPRDRRLLHPRRRHQRFHRHGGSLGRHLRRRSVPADAGHAELRRVRHRARRGPARPAGHALRAQQHRRRHQLHHRPTDRGVRRVRAGGIRQLRHVFADRRPERADQRHAARPPVGQAVNASSSDGYASNRFTDNELGKVDSIAVRGQVEWEPSDDFIAAADLQPRRLRVGDAAAAARRHARSRQSGAPSARR